MTATTKFRSGGTSISAELFHPGGPPNGGVIIIAYGSDGLIDNEHGPWASMIRDYAEALAGKGFTAMIPDYFQRTGTHPGDIDFENGGAEQIWLHRNDWQAAVVDSMAYARALPAVNPSRIGLLGFSLGGHLCLRARATAKVLVEFFAPVLDGLGPGGAGSPQVQIHHGDGDTLVGFASNAVRIDQELRDSGTATALFSYARATHGFSGSDPANTSARALSRTRTLKFFESHL